MPIVSRQKAVWDHSEGELITGGKCGPHELHIFQPSHMVLMRYEGTSPGYEWSDGSARRKIPAIRPGTIIFAPANQYAWIGRRSHSGGGFLALSIGIAEIERLADHTLNEVRLEFTPQADLQDEPIRRTLFAIKDEIANPGAGGRLYGELLLQQLVIQLMRFSSTSRAERRVAYAKGGLSAWQLRSALELLEADLREPPSLAALAARVRLSPTYFCTKFRQSTGMPPHRYLIERRIAKAKELMADRQLSLTDIALSTGFGSSSRFSVAFRSAVGVAPREYRRAL